MLCIIFFTCIYKSTIYKDEYCCLISFSTSVRMYRIDVVFVFVEEEHVSQVSGTRTQQCHIWKCNYID